MNQTFIPKRWEKEEYQSRAHTVFEQVDSYLSTPPKRILDIGCGYAYISQQFQKKYGTELWLLEGDFNATNDRERKASWGDVDTMKFYLPVKQLKKYWDDQNILYNFVDANNIHINNNLTFDFVCSWLSCGYHYPVATYQSLIKKHTNSSSVIIMDIRTKTLNKQQSIEVVKKLDHDSGKRSRLHYKFKTN